MPGEAFVAAAVHSSHSVQTAMRRFKKANLMLPDAIRRFIWEDAIYRTDMENKAKKERKKGRKRKDKEPLVSKTKSNSRFAILVQALKPYFFSKSLAPFYASTSSP